MTGTEGGDVDVVPAVVVVVSNGAAHAIHLDRKPRLLGAVGEGSIAIVVVKRGIRLRRAMTGPIHRVHEQDVLGAVVIVVEDAHPAAYRLGKVFLSKSTVMVTKRNSRSS